MRGTYHSLLKTLLLEEIARKAITQESLAEVVGMHQTTVGGILKKDKGTFDLDEADTALRHVGSTLKEFVADPRHVVIPPRPQRSRTVALLERAIRALNDDEDALQIVLSTARSVRARVGKKSMRTRGAAQGRSVRKTAERRRGA